MKKKFTNEDIYGHVQERNADRFISSIRALEEMRDKKKLTILTLLKM